jgi:hypothetical protein
VHLGLVSLQLVGILDFWDVVRICCLIKRGTDHIPLLGDGLLRSDAVLVEHLHQLFVFVLILFQYRLVLIDTLDVTYHVVHILVAALDSELLINDGMHLGNGEPAFQEEFDLLLNLFVIDYVLVLNLDRVVVMHLDGPRA